jgi:hypothetical protein
MKDSSVPAFHNNPHFKEYDPYRPQQWDPAKPLDRRLKLKRTLRRPFVMDLGDGARTMDGWRGITGLPIIERHWYFAVGCKVFDGLCINQGAFDEIDCASCIKSTFESFIKGCKHREFYIDPFGTRRCVACKDELGQEEDPDIYEEDDSPEEDDPPERDDVECIVNDRWSKNYRSWNIQGRWNQTEQDGAGGAPWMS